MSDSPSFDSAQLLAEVGWVRALARRLAADEHQADDLAQDTLVAAVVALDDGLRRPISLRAWLRGVLRNVSNATSRKDRRRTEREHASRSGGELPSTLDLVERASVQRSLVGLLLELAEPYRTTLLLKYFDELSNEHIAERMGVPPSTVATRAARGIALMRAKLRRRHPGDERDWLSALLPLREWARPVLCGTSTAILMSTKAKVLLSLAAVVGALFVYRSIGERAVPARAALDEPQSSPAAVADLEVEFSAGSSPRLAGTERVAATVPTAVTEPAAPDAEARSLPGRVIDLDGRAVSGVEVFAGKQVLAHERRSFQPASAIRAEDRQVFARARTGSDGRFQLSTSEPAGTVAVDDPRYTTLVASSFAAGDTELLVVVGWRLALGGVVVDPSGAPVAGAELLVRRPDDRLRALGIVLDHASPIDMTARAAADGSFSFSNAAEVLDGLLVASATGFEPWFGPLPEGGDEHLQIVLTPEGTGGELVTGKVVQPDGAPAAGALVSFGGISTETNEHGRFSLDPEHPAFKVLPRDTPLVLRAFLAGFAPAEAELPTPRAGEEGGWPAPTLVLGALDQLLAIAGQVVDQDGEPVANATVHLLDKTPFGQVASGPSREYFMTTEVESLVHGGSPQATTDAHGAFRIDGLLDKAYRLEAIEKATMLAARTEPVPSGTVDLRIRIDRSQVGVVAGRLVDHRGEGVAGVNVSIARSVEGMGFDFGASGVSAEDGAFRLEGTTTKGITLSLAGEGIVPELTRKLPAGADPEHLEIVVGRRCHVQFEWARWQDQGLAVVVLDGDDQPIELIQIRESMWSVTPSAYVSGEISDLFVLPDTAAHAVVVQGEEQLERVALNLVAGKVQRIEL